MFERRRKPSQAAGLLIPPLMGTKLAKLALKQPPADPPIGSLSARKNARFQWNNSLKYTFVHISRNESPDICLTILAAGNQGKALWSIGSILRVRR
jgi:hypothetical protein